MPQYRHFEARFAVSRHECRVGDECLGASAFTVRELNFGQHFRTPGLPRARYEVRVESALVADFLVDEIRELLVVDREGDDLDEVERALVERAWPEPLRVFEDPVLGAAVVLRYAYEFVLSCLWTPQGSAPRWVVNSVDDVSVNSEEVVLRGEVGRADLRRAYQDF